MIHVHCSFTCSLRGLLLFFCAFTGVHSWFIYKKDHDFSPFFNIYSRVFIRAICEKCTLWLCDITLSFFRPATWKTQNQPKPTLSNAAQGNPLPLSHPPPRKIYARSPAVRLILISVTLDYKCYIWPSWLAYSSVEPCLTSFIRSVWLIFRPHSLSLPWYHPGHLDNWPQAPPHRNSSPLRLKKPPSSFFWLLSGVFFFFLSSLFSWKLRAQQMFSILST